MVAGMMGKMGGQQGYNNQQGYNQQGYNQQYGYNVRQA
jgi:hypothetical protein